MAKQTIYFLTEADRDKMRRTARPITKGDPRPRAQPPVRIQDWVRVTSLTPQDGHYPGKYYTWSDSSSDLAEFESCWVKFLNGHTPDSDLDTFYFATMVDYLTISTDNRPRFLYDDYCCGAGELPTIPEVVVFDTQQNNLVLDEDTNTIIATGDGGVDFTGIAAPSPEEAKIIYFLNSSNDDITITHLDSDSDPGNQFFTLDGNPVVVEPGQEYIFTYDTVNDYWIVTPRIDEDEEIIIQPGTDAGVPLIVRQHSDTQTGDLIQITNHDGTVIYGGANEGGYFFTGQTTAPADGVIGNSQVFWFMDDSTNDGRVLYKGKDDSGNVFTITVNNYLYGSGGGQTFIGGTGSGEQLILQSTSNATRGGIELSAGDWFIFPQLSSAPSTASGEGALYHKNDGKLYWRSPSDGTEYDLTATSGGGGSVDGSGTANTVAKWSDSDTLTTSLITDDGAIIKMGDTLNAVIVDTVGTINLVAVGGIITIGGSGGSDQVGFFGSNGTTKPTVSGSKSGNAALGSLISALAAMGLIADGSS